MTLILVTAPASANPAVTLEELKAYLAIDPLVTDDDDLLKHNIAAITATLDGPRGLLNRALINQSWKLELDEFPTGTNDKIELPLPPTQSITSVKYDDSDGNEQTLVADTDYYITKLGATTEQTQIHPIDGWPAARDRAGAVRVEFVAGYGDNDSDIPADTKLLIKAVSAEFFERREYSNVGNIVNVMPAMEGLIARAKFWSLP